MAMSSLLNIDENTLAYFFFQILHHNRHELLKISLGQVYEEILPFNEEESKVAKKTIHGA